MIDLVATKNLNYGRLSLIKGQKFPATKSDAKKLVLIGNARYAPKGAMEAPINRQMTATEEPPKRGRGRPRSKTTYETK